MEPFEKLLDEGRSLIFGLQKEDSVESGLLIMKVHEIFFPFETGSCHGTAEVGRNVSQGPWCGGGRFRMIRRPVHFSFDTSSASDLVPFKRYSLSSQELSYMFLINMSEHFMCPLQGQVL